MKKIGIMGGTFNPVHMGHLLLGEWAMSAFGLDEVWYIPTGCSYMKNTGDILPPQIRYEMTALATADNPKMKSLDVEIRRQGYTYTYETLEELKAACPDFHFYFIAGADCLFSIENWKSPERIFSNCTMIAAVRGNTSLEQLDAQRQKLSDKYSADIRLLPFLQFDISSTMVRERIRAGQSVRYLVPEKVISYIEAKGLYGHESK